MAFWLGVLVGFFGWWACLMLLGFVRTKWKESVVKEIDKRVRAQCTAEWEANKRRA